MILALVLLYPLMVSINNKHGSMNDMGDGIAQEMEYLKHFYCTFSMQTKKAIMEGHVHGHLSHFASINVPTQLSPLPAGSRGLRLAHVLIIIQRILPHSRSITISIISRQW